MRNASSHPVRLDVERRIALHRSAKLGRQDPVLGRAPLPERELELRVHGAERVLLRKRHFQCTLCMFDRVASLPGGKDQQDDPVSAVERAPAPTFDLNDFDDEFDDDFDDDPYEDFEQDGASDKDAELDF